MQVSHYYKRPPAGDPVRMTDLDRIKTLHKIPWSSFELREEWDKEREREKENFRIC